MSWMTAGLVTSCNRKLTLYKKYLTNPSKQNKDKYIKYRNKLKALLRKSERLYYNEQFNAAAGNAKETWNILNAVLNKKHDVSSSSRITCLAGDVVPATRDLARFRAPKAHGWMSLAA